MQESSCLCEIFRSFTRENIKIKRFKLILRGMYEKKAFLVLSKQRVKDTKKTKCTAQVETRSDQLQVLHY